MLAKNWSFEMETKYRVIGEKSKAPLSDDFDFQIQAVDFAAKWEPYCRERPIVVPVRAKK